MITKKLILKKVTISTHGILGANNSAQSQDENTEEIHSSAFHDPTESKIDPMFLSFNETVCA
jgi:hypothetical protein